ncbi:MAG: c-type cytochrome, partial [Planctomycetota bacterium]|nr:c-type cytochrome [Planctomycetota bacterium]
LIRVASQCQSSVLDQYASEIVRSLATVLADGEAEMAVRANAALELVTFQSGNAEVFSMMVRQINPQTPPMLAYELLSSIKLSTASEGGGILIRALSEMTPQVKAKAIDVLLSRPQWTASLLTAVEGQTFDLNELTLEQKRALRSFPDAKLRDRAEALLAMGGGLPDADRERVLQSLMHVTEIQGDVKAGREVFTKVCSACHKHGEIGHAIGPNLTGMAVHPKEELLTHIIDPSRNVEGNFRLYTVQTIDGLVASGMLAGESKTSITIIDSQAKEIDIPREDIEELSASRKSVMPEGFEKQISEKELSNLLEFLTDKGPFLPISLDRYATAISTKGLFSNGDNGADRMIFDDWKPKVFKSIPFVLTDPRGKTTPNIILLHGPFGPLPPKMPKSVSLPCNTTAKAIHFLSGVGGWNHPYDSRQTVSMIVRLHYDDGETEDHELINGVHFADYIRRVDVPESEFAFQLGGQQLRYLKVNVKREQAIEKIELVKGPDTSAPIVMAVTAER